jgi:hypothetical protein
MKAGKPQNQDALNFKKIISYLHGVLAGATKSELNVG